MTAIDALREKIKHRYVYDYNKRGIGTARCADDCPCHAIDDVEALLEAAKQVTGYPNIGAVSYPDFDALAAAVRQVEGRA